MAFAQFLTKQLIDILEWNEPEDGILAWRFPMEDSEIQTGGQLTVRESQMAVFIDNGKFADVFGPGQYTLSTANLPLLSDLLHWDKGFKSPFKSDVYFFSGRLQIDQKWGTATPIAIRDKEFGALRLRCYGIFSYRIADARTFFARISGTRDLYRAADLAGLLRDTVVARMTEMLASSEISFLDMSANLAQLNDKITAAVEPGFAALGLALDQFSVQNVSLPDDLQKVLDQRTGMNMVGSDMDRYTRFVAAQSMNTAASNPNGGAGQGIGTGMGLGFGLAAAQMATSALHPAPTAATQFCTSCGHTIPTHAAFCPDCGKAQ